MSNVPEVITPSTIGNITPTRQFGPHDTFLTTVAFSADGSVIVTGDIQGTIKVWNAVIGVQRASVRAFSEAVRAIQFAPMEGDRLRFAAVANREKAAIYQLGGGDDLSLVVDSTHADLDLLDVTYTPGGRPLVVGVNRTTSDGRVSLTYADDGEFLTALRLSNDAYPNATFNRSGTRIAIGHSDGTVTVRQIGSGGNRVSLTTPFFGVEGAVFSPDDRRLAIVEANGDRVAVFDIETGIQIGPTISEVFANQVAFNRDGTLLAITTMKKGGSLQVYDVQGGETVRTVKGSAPLSFTPSGDGLTAGNNYAEYSKAMTLWDSRESVNGFISRAVAPVDIISASTYTVRQLGVLNGSDQPVRAIAFSPDNMTLATAGDDEEIHLWNTETGGESAVLVEHQADITGLAFSPDGRTLASSGGYHNNGVDNTVRLWDMDEGTETFVFRGHGSRVVGVAYHPRGDRLVSADEKGIVLMWAAEDGNLLQRIETPTPINDFDINPTGSLVATAHGSELALRDTVVRLYNLETGELLREITDLDDWVLNVTFSPDGNVLIVADYSGRVCGWDVTSGAMIKDLSGGKDVRYTPSQDLFAIMDEKAIKLVTVEGGRNLLSLRHGTDVTAMGFSVDGNLLAAGTQDGDVVVWGVPKASTTTVNTEQMSRRRVEAARSGRFALQLLTLTCVKAQENDGDETYLRLDGQTLWRIEGAGRKMHHNPNRAREVSVFNFKDCTMRGRDGWQSTDRYTPDDFRITGLTGPVEMELWEEDNFLRGGDDFLGRIEVSPAQAGQGEQSITIEAEGAHYVLTYVVEFE
jgi:WD40 repeat protein